MSLTRVSRWAFGLLLPVPWSIAYPAAHAEEEQKTIPTIAPHVKGEKEATPTVVKVIGETGGVLSWTAASPSWTAIIQVEGGEAEVAIQNVTATLYGPDGEGVKDVKCTIGQKQCSSPGKLLPAGRAAIRLNAPLALPGSYQGALTLAFGKNQGHTTTLQITRNLVALPAELTLSEAFAGSVDGLDVAARLRETSGFPLTVDLSAFRLRKKLSGMSVQLAAAPLPVQSARLPALGEVQTTFSIRGFEGAGEYELDVVARTDGWAPVQKSAKLLIRRSGALAVFWILLGIVGSFAYRFIATVVRPAQDQQRQLDEALTRLTAAQRECDSDDDRKVLGALKDAATQLGQSLAKAWHQPWKSTDESAKDLLEKIATLPSWLRMVRKVRALGPNAETAIVAKSMTLRDSLLDGSATAASMKAEIDQLTTQVDQQLGPELGNPLRKLRDATAKQGVVLPELGKAEEAFKNGQFDLARLEFDKARLDYLRWQAKQLLTALPRSTPAGVDEPTWRKTTVALSGLPKEIDRMNDADSAEQWYSAAYNNYLTVLCEGLRNQHGVNRLKLDAAKTLQQAQVVNLNDKLAQVDNALKVASSALAEGNLPVAFQQYSEAAARLNEFADGFKAVGGPMGIGGAAALVVQAVAPMLKTVFDWAAPTALVSPLVEALSRVSDRLGSWYTRRATFFAEAVLGIAAAVFGVLIGWQALQVDGPMWGSALDQIKALLWGLGLHQAAGVTFLGLTGLRTQMAK
jgi:hypothetical protein